MRGVNARAPYSLRFHMLSKIPPSRNSQFTISNPSNSNHSIHGEQGRSTVWKDWAALEGPPDERPLSKMGGGCFLCGRLPPLPLGDCEGSLCSKRRAEHPEDGAERVAGDPGMATGARLVAVRGSRSSNAKLESEESGRCNARKAWRSNKGCSATL